MSIPAQIARYSTSVEVTAKANECIRAVRVLGLAGASADAQRLAERFSCSRAFAEIVNKAATPAGTTLDSSWAGALASTLSSPQGFIQSLRDSGAFDRLLPDMRRVPMNSRVVVTALGASGHTVSEASAKPISRLTLAASDLTPIKSLVILVLSRELLLAGGNGADVLINVELAGAVAGAVDTAFVTALTDGLTSIPSQGATALGVRQDLRALVDSVATGAGSRLYLLANSTIAKRLAMLGTSTGGQALPNTNASTGGSIGGVPLVITDGITSNDLILVDAAQIAASSAAFELDRSNVALLNMNDSPDSPPTSATSYTNLWTENLVAIKSVRWWGVKRLASTAVALISNVTATGNSPA